MLALGIVEKVNSPYSVKVRIPVLHKAGGSTNETPTEELPDAMISTFSRSLPNYTVGTVVVVGFDRNDLTSPIILGELCIDKESEILSDMTVGSINVKGSAVLPKETYIGDVGGDKIKTLKNVTVDIQAQLDDLDRRVKNLESNS